MSQPLEVIAHGHQKMAETADPDLNWEIWVYDCPHCGRRGTVTKLGEGICSWCQAAVIVKDN